MRSYFGTAVLAAAAIGLGTPAFVAVDLAEDARAPQPVRRAYRMARRQIRNGFDPRRNRHTGLPHEHKREISRRARRRMGLAGSIA